jgi:hypothetical protein
MKKLLKTAFAAASVIGTAQTIYSLVPKAAKKKLSGLVNKAFKKITGGNTGNKKHKPK